MEIGAAERELSRKTHVLNQAEALAISMIQPVVQDAGAQVAAEHLRLAETAALEAEAQKLATQQAEERALAAEAVANAAKKEMERLVTCLDEARLDNEVLSRQLEECSQSSFRSAAAPPSRGRAPSSKTPSTRPVVPKLNLAAIGAQPSPAGSVDLLDLGDSSRPISDVRTVASYSAPGQRNIAEELQTALKIARALVPPPALAGAEPLQAATATRTMPPRTSQAPACSHAPAEGGGGGGDGDGPGRPEEDKDKKKKEKKEKPSDDGGGGGGGDDGGDEQPTPSGSSSSSSGDGGGDEEVRLRRRSKRRFKSKRKELDTVSVPPLPNASQFRAWRITALQNLDATAGRNDDNVIDWAR
ncbi:MAG: hypothetical protein GY953_28050, partial [bacterium]|nr:hypothetical protein [bacterium]